jgi:hypothetical protein
MTIVNGVKISVVSAPDVTQEEVTDYTQKVARSVNNIYNTPEGRMIIDYARAHTGDAGYIVDLQFNLSRTGGFGLAANRAILPEGAPDHRVWTH